VANLPPNRDTVITFTPWTTVLGQWTTSCSTRLANDENPANDKVTGSFRVESLPPTQAGRYAIVVSNATNNDPAWRAVVDTLYYKYRRDAQVFVWNSSVNEVRDALASYKPDFVAFVCRPAPELSETFIRTVQQMLRQLDTDPYGDAVWGIITGYEAADAMRIARTPGLIIRTTVSNTWQGNYYQYPPLRPFYQCVGTNETQGGPHVYYSFSDGTTLDTMDYGNIPHDRSVPFANWLNAETLNIQLPGHPPLQGTFDFLISSSHGNVSEWMVHYPSADEEGFFRSNAGQYRADTYNSGTININSTNPKLWISGGNCLVGNPNSINNLCYAWLHSAGGIGFVGYMVTTWYGYQGWGTNSRFIYFPGLHNFAQAHYAVNQSLLFDRANGTPGYNPSGLDYDRDAVAVYGDPAANVKMFPFPDTNW